MQHPHPMLGRYVIPDMPSADELAPFLRTIDSNRWYSNFGPLVSQFEHQLHEHMRPSTPDIALTTLMTCYHALQIGLQLFRLPEKANVLIPAVTFPACPLAIHHAGARPVLADIDLESWQLTPAIARVIATKMPIHAVMPVAVYGVPIDTEGWDSFIEETGIPVIIDAAAAFDVQPILRHGLVAYSLHATKPFSIGEGGILACRHREWIDEARCRSNFGTQQRITLHDGSNAKLSEYHGAVALAQMQRWTGIKQRRRDVFILYRDALVAAGLGVTMQKNVDQAITSAFMLQSPIHEGGPIGAKITNILNTRGIMAHRMYLPPLYHHPHFAQLVVADQDGKWMGATHNLEDKIALMRNSEHLHQSLFGLPFHAFLTAEDIAYAVTALAEILDTRPTAQS